MAGFGDLQPPQYRPGLEAHGGGDPFGPVVPVHNLVARRPAAVCGNLVEVRTVEALHGPRFEAVLDDATGSVVLVFLGRRSIAGLTPGMRLMAQGTPRPHCGRIEILNPLYALLGPSQGAKCLDGAADTRSDA